MASSGLKADGKPSSNLPAELQIIAKKACEYVSHYLKKTHSSPEFQATQTDTQLEQLYKDDMSKRKHHLVDIDPDKLYELLNKEVDNIKLQDIGQCHEYAVLCFHYIVELLKNEKTRDKVAYFVSLEDFDHSFIILDAKPIVKMTKEQLGADWEEGMDLDDLALQLHGDPLSRLSQHALIIDAWNSDNKLKIYPYSDKAKNLLGFQRIENTRRVKAIPFNEDFVLNVAFNSEEAIKSYLKYKDAKNHPLKTLNLHAQTATSPTPAEKKPDAAPKPAVKKNN